MAKKQITDPKEIEKKVKDLKIELLKQPQKKQTIRREIARLLTTKNLTQTKLEGKVQSGN